MDSSPRQEPAPGYIETFAELAALASTTFDAGQEVSFQPWGRFDNERHVGTVRMWDGVPDIISIDFMGKKAGVLQPDNERITVENFQDRKDIWKIEKIA